MAMHNHKNPKFPPEKNGLNAVRRNTVYCIRYEKICESSIYATYEMEIFMSLSAK